MIDHYLAAELGDYILKHNSVLDLLSEAIGETLQFHRINDGSDIPVDVRSVVANWLEEQRLKPEDCIEIWHGLFGLNVQKNFYIYRYYLPGKTAMSISLLVRNSRIVGESRNVVD